MLHYVEVIGPFDQTVIGPFATKESANTFKTGLHDKLDPNVFDIYVYDQVTYDNKVAYGPVKLVAAHDYVVP